jgi:hypothetical protein
MFDANMARLVAEINKLLAEAQASEDSTQLQLLDRMLSEAQAQADQAQKEVVNE